MNVMARNSGAHNIFGKKERGDPLVASVTLAQAIGLCKKIPTLLLIDCEAAEFEILADLAPLRGIRMLRGEFHSRTPGDIEESENAYSRRPTLYAPSQAREGLIVI